MTNERVIHSVVVALCMALVKHTSAKKREEIKLTERRRRRRKRRDGQKMCIYTIERLLVTQLQFIFHTYYSPCSIFNGIYENKHQKCCTSTLELLRIEKYYAQSIIMLLLVLIIRSVSMRNFRITFTIQHYMVIIIIHNALSIRDTKHATMMPYDELTTFSCYLLHSGWLCVCVCAMRIISAVS